MPDGMSLENLAPLKRKADEMVKSNKTQSGIAAVFANEVDSSLTWKFVDWLRTVTNLPIYVKVSIHSISLQHPRSNVFLDSSIAKIPIMGICTS